MISNGPGDPVRVTEPQEAIRRLAPDYPMFNICMGHQLTGLALGGKHYKLKFGHRGGNQPVKDLERDKVYITTQNHGFALDPDSLGNTGLRVTMTNLNDGSVEGLAHQDYPLVTTQFHPEATPGPLDAEFLFEEFISGL
jgi:carbamoyl-phosphate synthase small subunit